MILAILLLSSIPLEKIDAPQGIESFTGRVTSRGDLLGSLDNRLFHWNLEGRLVRTLQADVPITAMGFNGSFYWLTLRHVYNRPNLGTTLEFSTAIYDRDGQLLGTDKNTCEWYTELNGNYFAQMNIFAKMRDPEERPFMVRKFAVGYVGQKIGLHPGELCFFRLPELLRNFHMSHQGIFIASDRPLSEGPEKFLAKGGRFLVMYALEARIWQYDQTAIKAELVATTPIAKTVDLKLPGFVKTSGQPFQTNRPMPLDEFKTQSSEAGRLWSKVRWFGNLDEGYAIAYTVPSGQRHRIRLARLDATFAVIDQQDIPVDYTVLGAYQSEILTLHPKQDKNSVVFMLDRYLMRR